MVKCDVKDSMDVVSGANKSDCFILTNILNPPVRSPSPIPKLACCQFLIVFFFDMINDNGCTEFVIVIPKNGYMLLTRKRYDPPIVTKKSPK